MKTSFHYTWVGMSACVVLLHGATVAVGQPPPMTRIILASDGNGYFQHAIPETPKGKPVRFEVLINADSVDGILKSIKTANGTVNVTAVGVKASELKVPFNAKVNQSLLDLLTQARGSKLRIKTNVPAETVGVTLVGVESKDVKGGKVAVLTVAGPDGKLRSLPLDHVIDFEFLPPNQHLTESIRRQQSADTKALAIEVLEATKGCTFGYRLSGLPAWSAVHRADAGEKAVSVVSRAFIENATFYEWKDVDLTLVAGSLNPADEEKFKDEERFVDVKPFSLERQRRTFVDVPQKLDAEEFQIASWVFRPVAVDDKLPFNAKNPLATLQIKPKSKNFPAGSIQYFVDGFQLVPPTDLAEMVKKGDKKALAPVPDTRIKADKKVGDPDNTVRSVGGGNIIYFAERSTVVTVDPGKTRGVGPITAEFPADPDWQYQSGDFSLDKKIYTCEKIPLNGAKVTRSLWEESQGGDRTSSLLALSADDIAKQFLNDCAFAEDDIKAALQQIVAMKKKASSDGDAFKDQQSLLAKRKQAIVDRQPSGLTAEFYQQNAKALLADDAEIRRLTGEVDTLEHRKSDLIRDVERFILKLSLPSK